MKFIQKIVHLQQDQNQIAMKALSSELSQVNAIT